jgi:hypothetical protein
MTDTSEQQLPAGAHNAGDSVARLLREQRDEVTRLNRFSTRGIAALALFLGVSMLAWRGFMFLPAPETIAASLGNPPSAGIISIVLLVYTFSALILSLSRMSSGIEHRSSFSHVAYLAAFYFFYYSGKSLESNYWAVFGAGITILGVESYRIRTYCTEAIAKKKEDIEFMIRTGRLPPEE